MILGLLLEKMNLQEIDMDGDRNEYLKVQRLKINSNLDPWSKDFICQFCATWPQNHATGGQEFFLSKG